MGGCLFVVTAVHYRVCCRSGTCSGWTCHLERYQKRAAPQATHQLHAMMSTIVAGRTLYQAKNR